MRNRVITVFGGSGFVGRHVVSQLAAAGAVVRVAVRDTERARFLRTQGTVGQVVPVPCNIAREGDVRAALDGADGAVNLVGILYEKKAGDFRALHTTAAERIARVAAEAGVERFVHMSALGADPASPAEYARTKAAGEKSVHMAFPGAMIVRPSVVFGPEDGFFNKFAGMARISPFLPVIVPDPPVVRRDAEGHWHLGLFGRGGPHFQPVYVGDVARAIVAGLDFQADPGRTAGRVFELGGPETLSMKTVMERILATIERRRLLLPLPIGVAKIQAFFLEKLPKPVLTRDQVALLRRDNVVSGHHPTLETLGIEPNATAGIIPGYLGRYRPPESRYSANPA